MKNYQATEKFLSGKTILVTGATDGIGKQAALTYAQYGATVILSGRNTRKLEQVYDEIESLGYPQPAYIPLNLQNTDPAQYAQVAEVIEKEFGQLDGLLLNASDLGLLSPIDHFDEETWYRVMQVNVNSTFLLTKYCLPLIRKAKKASIALTSSGVGRQGRAYWGAYSVSKFATEGLMQILADELDKTEIIVNSINPGATQTKMRANAYPGEDPATLPTANDIMPAYLWLMDTEKNFGTGQAINARDFIK